MEGEAAVHVLWHGLPLCKFSREMPRFWPEGHRWVHPWDADKLATCRQCMEVLDWHSGGTKPTTVGNQGEGA